MRRVATSSSAARSAALPAVDRRARRARDAAPRTVSAALALLFVGATAGCDDGIGARADRARAAERTDVVRGDGARADDAREDSVDARAEDRRFQQDEGGSADRLVGVIRAALLDDPSLRSVMRDVDIGLDAGVVRVTGEVPYRADAARIERIVRSVAGGYDVDVRLEVGPRPGGGG